MSSEGKEKKNHVCKLQKYKHKSYELLLAVKHSSLTTGNLEIIAGQSTVPAKRSLHLKGNDILWSQPTTAIHSINIWNQG